MNLKYNFFNNYVPKCTACVKTIDTVNYVKNNALSK